MQFQHPFERLSPAAQKRTCVPLCLLTMIISLILGRIDTPLRTDRAPRGILSFEFAGDLPTAQGMIESWEAQGQVYAGLSLGLDYLFLIAYSSTIGLGCVCLGQRLAQRNALMGEVGIVLAWAQWVAAGLDGVENYALIRVLLGSKQRLWPSVAWWCALPKFVIVFAGLIYILMGIGIVLFSHRVGAE